jgi:hypothetical protein
MTKVAEWVQGIWEEANGHRKHLSIGDTIKTTEGKLVKIIGGRYWGKYGLSNFWDWKEILPSGKLSKRVFCGYGYINEKGELITDDEKVPAKRR